MGIGVGDVDSSGLGGCAECCSSLGECFSSICYCIYECLKCICSCDISGIWDGILFENIINNFNQFVKINFKI